MNIISFTLFGSIPRYCRGAISNVKLAHEIYPDWNVWVYHDDTVPEEIVAELRANGATTINKTGYGIHRYTWRFLAHDVNDHGRFIVRDCDSRLNFREKAAVDEWIASGKTWHVMRDHPTHQDPIMAGMWGGKLMGLGRSMEPFLKAYKVQHTGYGYDQVLLKTLFWHRISQDAVIHDSNSAKHRFPTDRGDRFVGEVYNENDEPVAWTPEYMNPK